MEVMQENNFALQGSNQQMVELTLKEGESVISRSGGLMFMEQGIFHEVMNKSSRSQTAKWCYTNDDSVERKITFNAPYSGKVVPVNLNKINNQLICRSNAFLCSSKGISIDIEFAPSYGSGYLDEASLAMELLVGKGIIFMHSAGDIIERNLKEYEGLRIDSRYLIAMTANVDCDVQKLCEVGEEESLLYTTVSGPGIVWLQTASSIE